MSGSPGLWRSDVHRLREWVGVHTDFRNTLIALGVGVVVFLLLGLLILHLNGSSEEDS